MALRSHLTRRGSRYYFRQRVPTDLVERLGCKEIRKSLLSSSPREAERLLVLMEGAYSSFFERVRAMADDETPKEQFALTHELVWKLSEHWRNQGKKEAERDFAVLAQLLAAHRPAAG